MENKDFDKELDNVISELEQSQPVETEETIEDILETLPVVNQPSETKINPEKKHSPIPLEKLLKDTAKELVKSLNSKKGIQLSKPHIQKGQLCKTNTRLEFTNHYNTEYNVYDSEECADQNPVYFSDILRQGRQLEQNTNHVYGIGKSHKPLTQRINDMKQAINTANQTKQERINEYNKVQKELLENQQAQQQAKATEQKMEPKEENK